MKRKKLLSFSLAALLATTMPSMVWASETIEIECSDIEMAEENEYSDIEMPEENQDEDLQKESEADDGNIELENSDNQLEDIESADIDLFTSEQNDIATVGDGEEVLPAVKRYVDYTTLASTNKEVARGMDNVINLKCNVVSNVADIRTDERLIVKADIYIDENKVNTDAVILTAATKNQVTGTYTLSKESLAQYPEGTTVKVQYYSDYDSATVKTLSQKKFTIYTPAVANPVVEEITPWGESFEFERGEACSGAIAVKLSDRPVEGKDPYCAVYINGQRKTEPVALQRNTNVDPDKGYRGDISIAPELTEYLPEGTKIQIKVGFGSEMEDVSDEKVLEIEATGKPFIQGAKVDEVSVYKDASHEKGLYWVRAGRTYTAYITGKFRDVVEKDPLDVYAGVYVSGKLVGELLKVSVEADNSAYNGTITFTLPDDTPSNPLVGNAVRVKVGIGSEMDNGRSIAIRSGSKLDPNEIKVTDLKVLDGFQEEEVKHIDRQNPENFSVFMKLEGLPDDLIGTYHEEWLGDQMIDSGLGSPEGMSIFMGSEKAKLIKDYEGTSLTLKIISKIDEEAIFTYEMPIVGLTTKEEETANTVADQLKALPAVDKITLEDKESVKAARDAYDALNEDQKKLVPEEQVKALTEAEAKITQLQKAAQVKPKITLNVTSLPIQAKKSTTGVRIKTTAIKGDKIKSAKSSNKKVVQVTVKNGKLTIKGLKAGKATVTVTSTKGAKATVKITVQKQKVATKKLSATVSTKQTLKKGKKVTLKVAKTPFTAQDTVKWTSSNKKIATVTSKGVVKGLKKGTATITAKAGKKVVKFKVTVK